VSFYVARQVILNRKKELYAYELLFRDSLDNIFPDINGNEATAKIIDGLEFNLGLHNLTEGSLAFINFTHDSLIQGYPFLLPYEQIVVEILETAKPEKKLLTACINLKERGYTIALDDYQHEPIWRHFFPYIDIIKIDYSFTSKAQFEEISTTLAPFPHIKLLAEKVETYEDYHHALDIGCEYFQGYFFSKPEVIKTVAFTPSQLSVVNLMAEASKAVPDITAIVSIFESDVNLSFKLLRYSQSPIFKRAVAVETIKQAVVVLGMQELKRFVSLLFSAQFSQDKPQALAAMALVRARFCELVVQSVTPSHSQSSGFLTGLLSLLDAMVDGDIKEIMGKLPLSLEIKQAIVNRVGKYADILRLCELYENAEWKNIDQHCQTVGIDPTQATTLFQQSMNWSSESIKALHP